MASEAIPNERKTVSTVLLVQPEQGEFVKRRIFQPGVEIPLNLACLAAHLEREEIPSRILDLRLWSHTRSALEAAVRKYRPSIVGISAYSSEIDNAMEVARTVKKIDQGILTVLGGHHASAEPVQSLKEGTSVDCLVLGEGEITLTNLVRCWERGEDISHLTGTAFREGDRIRVNTPREPILSLDELSFPARDKLDLNRYVPNPGTGNFMHLPSTGIMASRGCPYRCRYCSKGVWGAHMESVISAFLTTT
jgi:anaerobic magnesium-protoporphyrin IX monomethyl ester cyclase